MAHSIYDQMLILYYKSKYTSNIIVLNVTDLIFILFFIFCTLYTHVSLLCRWFELINVYVVVVVVVVVQANTCIIRIHSDINQYQDSMYINQWSRVFVQRDGAYIEKCFITQLWTSLFFQVNTLDRIHTKKSRNINKHTKHHVLHKYIYIYISKYKKIEVKET